MTPHNTHTLKPVWVHHKPHATKHTDWAIPTIIVGLCADLTLIYIWCFYLYQSMLLP
jgi:hypothetical protein